MTQRPLPRRHGRAKLVRVAFVGGVLLMVVGGVFLWRHVASYESTDDAQVDLHLYPVSARVSRYVIKVNVEDNQTLLFSVAKGSSYSLEALSLPGKNATPFGGIHSLNVPAATFSPDGRWVAYTASESVGLGAGSLFVQPFPTTGAKYQISKTSGLHPMWSRDGKELFRA